MGESGARVRVVEREGDGGRGGEGGKLVVGVSESERVLQ